MALISGMGPPPSHPSRDDSLSTAGDDGRRAFRLSLGRLPSTVLRRFAERRGFEPEADEDDGFAIAAELVDQLDDPAVAAATRERLDDGERLAVGLFGLTESPRWPARGVIHALSVLGASAGKVVDGLLERGLLAVAADGPALGHSYSSPHHDLADFLIHPALASGARIHPPTDPALRVCEAVVQIRESDGLEPILRLAALWQRIGVEPARLTQSGSLYKRDRERIEEDPVISGPFLDAQADAGDAGVLIMELAKRIGLIRLDQARETLTAAPADFWTENAFHLPQMIASAWLGLRSWREWSEVEASTSNQSIGEPLIYLRPALLLWLAGLASEAWVTLVDLAEHLNSVYPDWDRLAFQDDAEDAGRRRPRTGGKQRLSREDQAGKVLESVLLGGARAMGLVRTADETTTGRKAVQLTALGRYAMRVGPPPAVPPPFEKFLFAQPNLDVIAYRQGLTPSLIGRLSQFAWWTKIDAAIELRLTQESIGGGLEWGMTVARMLEILTRHSQRPLPGSLTDAVERWARHRERVVFYEAATLIEFDTRRDRDQAVEQWAKANGEGKPFLPVGERFILVEDARDVPTGRISTTAARDYRLPPERCVAVEADGVTLVLDPTRSDLLIDAELSRFADEAPADGLDRVDPLHPVERRFVVTPASLRRGLEHGLTPALLADWFARRTGIEPPPAVKLMASPPQPKARPWRASRRLVLEVPSAELLDGVEQHPLTRPWLGDRLGPVSIAVAEEHAEQLRAALAKLGVAVEIS